MTTLIAGLYFIITLLIVAFILYMIFRAVRAIEKIADTYEKKNSSV